MKNKKLTVSLFALMMLGIMGCNKKSDNADIQSAYLTGTLLNFGNDATLTRYDLIGSLMGESYKLPKEEKGQFAIELTLKSPAYFRLGRNHLYLSPGDSIEMKVDFADPENSTFKGTRAAVESCLYLSQNAFPKAGSYAGSSEFYGMDMNIEDVPRVFHEKGEKDLIRLKAFSNLSPEFVKQETARIKYHTANSLLNYSFYGKKPDTVKSREDHIRYGEKLMEIFTPALRKYFDDYHVEEHMDLGVFRSLAYNLANGLDKKLSIKAPEKHIVEFVVASNFNQKLQNEGLNKSMLNSKDSMVATLSGQIYIDYINKTCESMKPTMAGSKASDFAATNAVGKPVKLSDYQGKLIVVDVWATWCGPCIKEAPYFEAIEKKYEGNEDIVFLALSIDRDEKAWKQYLFDNNKQGRQWLTGRNTLEPYNILGIPRYFVIDKDLTIVDVFAPAPSSGKLEQLIEDSLKG